MESGGNWMIIFATCAILSNENVFSSGLSDSLVNIALRKPASQSSTYIGQAAYGDTANFNYSASLAVDGNNSTNFRNDSCSHTDANHTSAWWEVDLQGSYLITRVKIYQRSDRLTNRNAGSTISGKLENNEYIQLKNVSESDSSVVIIDIPSRNLFKGIRIYNQKAWGKSYDVYICLCEVQVFTDVDERIDGDSVCNNNGKCVNTQGSFNCICHTGFTGKICETDVDECTLRNICSGRGRCINTVGSFTCECNAGYTGQSCNTVPQCKDLEAPRHSQLSYTNGIERKANTFNATVLMACIPGYIAVGETLLRCGESGKWGGSLGRCTVIRCENQPIQSPVHGKLNYSGGIEGIGTYNTEAITLCDQGYHLTMATKVSCKENGKWEGSPGKCSVIQCTMELAQPDNSELTYNEGIEGSRTYNTVVTARCKEGYNLTEKSHIRCNEQGEWEGSSRHCSVIFCKELIRTNNSILSIDGGIEGNWTYNTTATVACDLGYTLTGNKRVRCTHSSQWNGSIGYCVDVDECRDGDSVCSNNAYCINTKGSFNCRCNEGFTGKNCETDVDECKHGDSVCNNNGYCINTQGSFICICKEGFTGRNCETELWQKKLFAGVAAAVSVAVTVIITLLIIWRRGGLRFCCNGPGHRPEEEEITRPQPDLRMGTTSNNAIQSDDAYEEINEEPHNNMIELSEYLEPTVSGIGTGNREYYNCRNEYEKLHPNRNNEKNMYSPSVDNTS